MPHTADATTDPAYVPPFAYTNAGDPGTAAVVANQLELNTSGAGSDQEFRRSGLTGPFTLSALVGASNSGGSYNVGLVIGGNNIVFHPQFGGAALRVEGTGGFGNTDVGFMPAAFNNPLKIVADGTGNFTVTLTNGANPAQSFTTSYSNSVAVGGTVGVRRSGPLNAGTGNGTYDDFKLQLPWNIQYGNMFDTNVANEAAFSAAYSPPLTPNLSGGAIDVTGGVVRVQSEAGQNETQRVDLGSYSPNATQPLLVTADIGSTIGGGPYNVGIRIGGNNIVFHPGLAGGAFRVEGAGGFGNTDMGFEPAINSLHRLQIIEHLNGLFELSLTDRANPANVFSASFTNLASVGGEISLHRSGGTDGLGLYDNFVVALVPEPGTALLGMVGFGVVAGWCRRRRSGRPR